MARGARVDRARPSLHAVLDLERGAGDSFDVHRTLQRGEGPQGSDAHGRGRAEAAPEGDHRPDLEPEWGPFPSGLDRPTDVRVLRVLEGGAVDEPLIVQARVHLRAEVDRGREGGLSEDDRVLPEEDQLPGGGGPRHRVRIRRTCIKGSRTEEADGRGPSWS